jgi:hypothetical protein
MRWFVVSILIAGAGGGAVRDRVQTSAPVDLVGEFERAPYFFDQLVVAQKIVRAGDKAVFRHLAPWLTDSRKPCSKRH